jgi:hypothetical protein
MMGNQIFICKKHTFIINQDSMSPYYTVYFIKVTLVYSKKKDRMVSKEYHAQVPRYNT